jgi:hypothetical protein
MATIRFKLTSMEPGLLMHNPAGMQSSKGLNRKVIPTPEEEAERSSYRLPTGQLYVKAAAFRSALIEALKGRRIGKNSASKVAASVVFTTEECCPLANGKVLKNYEIDLRRAVIQGQGVLRARACVPSWHCEVEFEYDPDFVTPEIILEGMQLAGRLVGVGDYRPRGPVWSKGTGGPYGRFTVEQI